MLGKEYQRCGQVTAKKNHIDIREPGATDQDNRENILKAL